MADKKKPHVVIIGGGFGGLTVARALRRADCSITLIDRRNYHLFQPLLYQVATAALSPADIATPIRSILSGHQNTDVWMAEVTGIDKAAKQVLFKEGLPPLSFDHLIIATGSWYTFFNHPEWNRFAPGLKSIWDATKIRRKMLLAFEAAEIESNLEKKKGLLTFVLVGAGPTGVEMAGSIAELAYQALRSDFRHIDPRSTRVLLIEAGPRVLAGFPDSLSQKAQKKLESLGVEILTQTRVEDIDRNGVTIAGKVIPTHNVIWCAGVVASPAGKWLNTDVDRMGRVKVEKDLSVPGSPDIYVIGDTACFLENGQPLPGVAPVAMQQGRHVAAIIRKQIKNPQTKDAKKPFKYFNKGNLATVGRAYAVVDFAGIRLAGLFAWLAWLVVHIYYLIGFKNRVIVMMEWAWAYLTFQRGARLITRDRSEGGSEGVALDASSHATPSSYPAPKKS
jgi:NADH dehydrogenase